MSYVSNFDVLGEIVKVKDSEARELISKLENNEVITVESYGAVGDGVTDSTEAINQCLKDNPCKTIVFKGGTYIISDTLEMWGASGGAEVILGGAILKWAGARNGVMINIENWHDPKLSSVPRIIGGTLDGADECGILIRNHTFYTDIGGTKFINARKYGILAGTEDFTDEISSQCKFHDLHFFMDGELSSVDDTVAICISDPDNQISNVVTYMWGVSFELHTGGNSFSNCHTTPGYLESYVPNAENWKAAHIRIRPKTSGNTGVNLFSNCYFNVGKYVVLNDQMPTSLTSMFTNSHYTYYTSANLPFEAEAFMWGGYRGVLEVDNFDVLHGDNIVFRDYFPIDQVSATTLPKMKFNQYPFYPERSIINAQNYCTCYSEPVPIINPNQPIPSTGVWYEIGAVIMTYANTDQTARNTRGCFKLEYSVMGRYGEAVVAFLNDGTPEIRYEICTKAFDGKRLMLAKTPKTITINSRTYYYYPLYVYASGGNTDRTNIKMYSLEPWNKCYVRNHISAETPNVVSVDGIEFATEAGLSFTTFYLNSEGVHPKG